MKRRYQIRDPDFGLPIDEADFAAEALGAFLDKEAGDTLVAAATGSRSHGLSHRLSVR
jgi:hypothetical protein